MRHRIGKRALAIVAIAALVACAGTLMGASDKAFKITSPTAGAKVKGNVVVRLVARGFDDLAYVIFGVDEARPHSSNSLPYRFALNTEAMDNGPHTLSAWGFNHYGLVASAKPVTIVVANAAAPRPRPAAPEPMLIAPPAAAAAPAGIQAEARAQPAEVKAQTPEVAIAPAAETKPQPAGEPSVALAEVAASPAAASLIAPAAGSAAAVAKCDSRRPVLAISARPDRLTILVDGGAANCEVGPEIRGGIAYGPLRGIVERIGGRLGWNHAAKRATAETAQARIVVTVGNATAQVNEKPVTWAGPVWLKQGRTMAPVRSCAEALRMRVTWEPERTALALFSPSQEVGMLSK